MEGHQTKTKTKDTIRLDYSSICYIASRTDRMDVGEGNLQVKDIDMILEKLSNNAAPLRYILTSSDYYIITRGPDVGAYRPPRPQLWEMLWL